MPYKYRRLCSHIKRKMLFDLKYFNTLSDQAFPPLFVLLKKRETKRKTKGVSFKY